MKEFLQHHKKLNIICLVDRFNQHAARPAIQRSLPWWIPDWTVPALQWVVPMMASQSARSHIGNCLTTLPFGEEAGKVLTAGNVEVPFQVSFSIDLRTLTCQGIMIDFADEIGALKVIHRSRHKNRPD